MLFLTAYNYCIGIFSGEKDTISTSIHSGRTDGRWARLAGPLFLTYIFRCTQHPHETVEHLLKTSGQQIMDTMRCYVSTLHADEMFFQYQGDILNVDEIGGAPAVRQKVQLDSPSLVRPNSSPERRNSRPWQVKQIAAASRLARSAWGENPLYCFWGSTVNTSLSHNVISS